MQLFFDDELDSCRSGIILKLWQSVALIWRFCDEKFVLASSSKGLKKIELFSKVTNDSVNLRFERLIAVKKVQFCFLKCKVINERRWLLNSDIHSNSFIWCQKVLMSFSHYFISNRARLEIFTYIGINSDETFILLIFDSPRSLGRKVQVFQSLGI